MNKVLQNYNEKNIQYFGSIRSDIILLVPDNINNLLDVGCGAGNFAQQVKKDRGIEVWGVELHSDAAKKASKKLDKVYNCSVEEMFDKMKGKKFDCISFNDVLEHLTDPYDVLVRAKNLLTKKGVILLSVPNIRKLNYMIELVFRKDWKYEESGVMDKTHLRFFTKKSLIRMFDELDYDLLRLDGLQKDKSFKANLVNVLSLGFFEDALYLQFAAVIKPKTNT